MLFRHSGLKAAMPLVHTFQTCLFFTCLQGTIFIEGTKGEPPFMEGIKGAPYTSFEAGNPHLNNQLPPKYSSLSLRNV